MQVEPDVGMALPSALQVGPSQLAVCSVPIGRCSPISLSAHPASAGRAIAVLVFPEAQDVVAGVGAICVVVQR